MDWLRENRLVVVFVLLVSLAGWLIVDARGVHHPAGELVAEEPIQKDTERGSFTFKGYLVNPLADFDIRARVLSTERYYFDRGSKLSPVDFALGWGPMSDSALIDKLDISQDHRWWMWTADQSVVKQMVSDHAANMHMIPADSNVEHALKRVRTGHVVHIVGKLVRVEGDDGFVWASSLSRTDTGDHSCEVIFVESVTASDR